MIFSFLDVEIFLENINEKAENINCNLLCSKLVLDAFKTDYKSLYINLFHEKKYLFTTKHDRT